MLIHGTPLRSDVTRDRNGQDRFWYWHGASGRRYIHSIYRPGSYPKLPGATYVLVKRTGAFRTALAAGRLSDGIAHVDFGRSTDDLELHLHLMAETWSETDRILNDLRRGLEEAETVGSAQAA